jgi:hypothetical protein
VGDSSRDRSIGHRFGLSGLTGQGEVAENALGDSIYHPRRRKTPRVAGSGI